jgi:hypothetical protein
MREHKWNDGASAMELTGSPAESSAYLAQLGEPINILLGRCNNYSDLLRGDCGDPLSYEDILRLVQKSGRLIISGRGGSGKSTIMRRIAVAGSAAGLFVAFIDLSRWSQEVSSIWRNASGNTRESVEILLRALSTTNVDVTDIECMNPYTHKMFLIDGLNETPGSVADEIISVCDDAAALLINCSFALTDRLVRRNLRQESRWLIVTPLAVKDDEVRRLINIDNLSMDARKLLDSPYFIDKAIREELKSSPLSTIRDFVESRGKLSAVGMTASAAAAYSAYKIDQSRMFHLARFVGDEGEEAATKLLEGGVLVHHESDYVTFNHHWVHDYLASKYVSSCRDLWDVLKCHETFDVLTFKANSFDAIAFSLEQLEAADRDEFLRAVYDWNPYAAGYALAEVEAVAPAKISDNLRTIILAMLADKKFDRLFYSAQRACDALDLFSDAKAIALRDVTSRAELIDIISKENPESELFSSWQRIFTSSELDERNDDIINDIVSEDSIIGWTAANASKRLILSSRNVERLVNLADHERGVVRWRACHAMGGKGYIDFWEVLMRKLLEDEDENVGYGAIRSLVETGSLSEELAVKLKEALLPNLDNLLRRPRVCGEFSRAVFLSAKVAPVRWADEVSKIFYKLADLARDANELEKWLRLSSDLRRHVELNQ